MGIKKEFARQLFEQARYPNATPDTKELTWRPRSQSYSVYSIQVEFETFLAGMEATQLSEFLPFLRRGIARMNQAGVFSPAESETAIELLNAMEIMTDGTK